jgi:hypothetical protein
LKQVRDFLESFVVVVLVIAGLAGLMYRTFRAGGWFEGVLEYVAELVFSNPYVSVPAGILIAIALAWWHDRRMAKGIHSRRLPTIVLYALMAAGVYFLGRYALVGSF